MRKAMMLVFVMVALLTVATPVYAQGGGSTGGGVNWAIPLGAGLGLGIAAGLCGLGLVKATGSAVEALARNPGARGGLLIFLILGLALIESLALYTLLIANSILKLK